MTVAVELLFDAHLDHQVRTLWHRLAEAGLNTPSTWTGPRRRPHVSLAVGASPAVDRGSDAAAWDALAGLTRSARGAAVRLETPAWFTGGVLHLALAWSHEIASAHATLWAGMDGIIDGPWPEYAPGRWLAHCTLATHVGPMALTAAMGVLAGWTALTGSVSRVALGIDGALVWETAWDG